MFRFIRYTFLVALIIFTSKSYEQNKIKPTLRQFSFGEAYFYDGLKQNISFDRRDAPGFDTLGLLTKDGAFYIQDKSINNFQLQKYLYANEIRELNFNNIKTDIIMGDSSITEFNREFYTDSLTGLVGIYNVRFNKPMTFNYSFLSMIKLYKVSFLKFDLANTTIGKIKSNDNFYFESVNILLNSRVESDTFNVPVQIYVSHLNSTSFSNDVFQKDVAFMYTTFNTFTDFSFSIFHSGFSFLTCIFKDTLNLTDADFKEGADFRTCNFDSLETIYMDLLKYPTGKLFIEWNMLDKLNGTYRIQIAARNLNNLDKFLRLQMVYNNLRSNYLAQGDKESADRVKYELECRRDEMLKNPWQSLYGFFLGYGYKPWRYILFLVFPVIVFFSIILYVYYYPIIFEILDKDFDRFKHKVNRIHRRFFFPTYYIEDKENKKEEINLITRIWHSIFFGTSLLLAIRFRKEWINRYNKNFLFIITVGYLLGICMYLFFVIYVQSSKFDFLKEIFGL